LIHIQLWKGLNEMLQTVEAELNVDGSIRLLEPLRVSKPTRVLVTLLEADYAPAQQNGNAEQPMNVEPEDWHGLSVRGLAPAYQDTEPEYPETLVREPNPEYERG
jgi:hypothetical protein